MFIHPMFEENGLFGKFQASFDQKTLLYSSLCFRDPLADKQRPELLMVAASNPLATLPGDFHLEDSELTLRINVSYPPAAGRETAIFFLTSGMVSRCLNAFHAENILELFTKQQFAEKEVCRILSCAPVFRGMMDGEGSFAIELYVGEILPLDHQYLIALMNM